VQAEWVEGINDHGAGPASDRAGEIRDCGYHSIQNVRDVILLAEEARRKLRWIANERKLDHMRLVGLLEAMEAALDTNR